jgi:iron complex outermembrane receptor protein
LIVFAFTLLNANGSKKDTLEAKTKEVIITGMKYPETILEIPFAVSSFNKADFQFNKSAGIDEALNNIPGVLALSRSGSSDVKITIRGFGARGAGDRSNAGTSRGIKFLFNGIPETEPDGRTSLDLFDMSIIERAEILRSNSSSLWGNAAGGVINYFSLPEKNQSFIDAGYSVGAYGYMKYNVNAAGKLGDGMIKGSYVHSETDGWRQNSNAERSLANVSLRSFSIRGVSSTQLGLHITGVINKLNIPGPLTQQMYDSSAQQANQTYLSRIERRENRIFRIGATLDHNFDLSNSVSAMLFATPKYLQRSERNTYRDFTRYHLGGSVHFKNEMNLSDKTKNTFLLGMDDQIQDGAIIFYSLTEDANRSNILQQNKAEGANSFGVFLQNEVVFENSISIIFGIRYDNINYNSRDFTILGSNQQRVFEHYTPKLALSFKLNEESMLYASYGGGVEVPAGNETDPSPYLGADTVYLINPLLDPVVSKTYEIGYKSSMQMNSFVNLADFELSTYYIDIKNDIIPYSGGRYYMTAGKTSRFGIEAGVKIMTESGLYLKTNFTMLNSKYNDYKIDSVHIDPNKIGKYADYSNNKAAGIPGMFYRITLGYQPKFIDGLSIEVFMDGIGSYYTDDANKIEVPSSSTLNVKLSYEQNLSFNNFGFNLFVGANNLLNTKYIASSFINPEVDKVSKMPYFIEPGLPMNIYAGISLKWN